MYIRQIIIINSLIELNIIGKFKKNIFLIFIKLFLKKDTLNK